MVSVKGYNLDSGGSGGWWIIDEPEIHFVRDTEVLVPDLAGWRRDRMPALPLDQRFEVVPDWICEVLSPATASKDREVKMPVYAEYGALYAWITDPTKRVVEICVQSEQAWTLQAAYTAEQTLRAVPFEAAAFQVAALWE